MSGAVWAPSQLSSGSQPLSSCLPQPSRSSSLLSIPAPPGCPLPLPSSLLPGRPPTSQASAGGQGFEEGELPGEVVAVRVLAGALRPPALGLLALLQLLQLLRQPHCSGCAPSTPPSPRPRALLAPPCRLPPPTSPTGPVSVHQLPPQPLLPPPSALTR